MTAKNVHRDAILEELARWNVEVLRQGHGGRHSYVEAKLPNGIRVKFHHSHTRSSEMGRIDNIRLDVRKRLRRVGVELKKLTLAEKPKAVIKPPRPPGAWAPQMVTETSPTPPQAMESKIMTDGAEKKRRRHVTLTRVESNLIARTITHNSVEREDHKFEYAEGWSDKRVAEVVTHLTKASPPITTDQVTAERKRTFIDWVPEARPKRDYGPGPWAIRVQQLLERMSALEQRVTDLEAVKTDPDKEAPYTPPHMPRGFES